MATTVSEVTINDGEVELLIDENVSRKNFSITPQGGDIKIGPSVGSAPDGYPVKADAHASDGDHTGDLYAYADGANVTVHVWEVS